MRMGEQDRRYLHIALPAAFEGLFMILLSSVDIIMVGALGTEAIAAVCIFTQPRMMLLTVARSLASCVTLITAQCFGRGDGAAIGRLLRQTLVLTVIVLGLAHILFFVHLEGILGWMGAEREYMALALEYGELALAGVFITSLTAVLQAVQLGRGETRAVMVSNVQGNVVNVIGNALFIFGLFGMPRLGVAGAAVGTVLGTLWSLAATIYAMRECDYFAGGWRDFVPTRRYFREFLPVFGGIFSEQGFERVGMVLYTRMVAELGTAAYAVHAICMNFCDFYYSFGGGLGKASMVLAGHAHGAGDTAAWRASLRAGLRWSVIFSTIACVLTYALRAEIFSIYSSDALLLPMGALIMAFVAVVSYPEAHAMVCAGVLRGSGRTTAVAAYSFVSIAFLRPIITYALIYTLDMGLPGAWLALAIDQSLRALCASFLVYRYSHEKNKILAGIL